MTGIWVDTDFGFDDLWALLVLRHLGCSVDGVSLVAGNATLEQVTENARRAKATYGFDWPAWQGAPKPLVRALDTPEDVLGPKGMQSRGEALPPTHAPPPPEGALAAMEAWLTSDKQRPRQVLTLGPLTNLAMLVQQAPSAASRIDRLVCMGGSTGPGNHTPLAEFNAAADPEALAVVAEHATRHATRFDIVDLVFCRTVRFSQPDMPATDQLTGDLLGGYLDIAISRGRQAMAIYDPVAALAIAHPDCMSFSQSKLDVSTVNDDTYGATTFRSDPGSTTRLATTAHEDLAAICLDALTQEAIHGAR